MPEDIEIRGHGATVKIEVFGYERLESTNVDDANWLKARCAVRVNEFSCDLGLSIRTYDLVQFQSELHDALSTLQGGAKFLPLEASLQLEVKFKTGGRADVTGTAQTVGLHRVALSFAFDSDQSFLSQTDRQLKAILERFPIRKNHVHFPSN